MQTRRVYVPSHHQILPESWSLQKVHHLIQERIKVALYLSPPTIPPCHHKEQNPTARWLCFIPLCIPLPFVFWLGAYQKNVNNEATFPIDPAVYKQSSSFWQRQRHLNCWKLSASTHLNFIAVLLLIQEMGTARSPPFFSKLPPDVEYRRIFILKYHTVANALQFFCHLSQKFKNKLGIKGKKL